MEFSKATFSHRMKFDLVSNYLVIIGRIKKGNKMKEVKVNKNENGKEKKNRLS